MSKTWCGRMYGKRQWITLSSKREAFCLVLAVYQINWIETILCVENCLAALLLHEVHNNRLSQYANKTGKLRMKCQIAKFMTVHNKSICPIIATAIDGTMVNCIPSGWQTRISYLLCTRRLSISWFRWYRSMYLQDRYLWSHDSFSAYSAWVP